jgi:hypothetical protein
VTARLLGLQLTQNGVEAPQRKKKERKKEKQERKIKKEKRQNKIFLYVDCFVFDVGL